MNRRFQFPHVVEIVPNGAFRTGRPVAGRRSQRSLVEASLLRRPQLNEPEAHLRR
ncbi:hypothetical protein OM076_20210 [Solirubrobacter ginsenosidimutans]|uniref:Uncharacterized protein n=1 Tax=Solirubrobacter ginsenosidimutans TaxID=490573 RepID=A0A9X3MU31_9ACTN|nr:hypothetical protein [Solirubrobacter ginsenosidimutans]